MKELKKKIIKKGGKFLFNENVIKFNYAENKISKVITNKKVYKIEKNLTIISTLPISLTAYLLGKKNKLSFRGICSVYLFYNQKEILPKNHHWLYFDSEKLLFNRITENKKLSKFTAPLNQSFLTAEITYTKGDNFSKLNSDTVIKKVVEQIKKTKLANNDKLIDTAINYEPFVYPVQFANYKKEVATIKSFVESFDNLFSIGAGGEFNYADSQILFHKSFDLVNSLINKNDNLLNETKNINYVKLNNKVKINNSFIGNNSGTFIVAEAGLNHNGSFELAKKLIDNAKASKCDAIKFQSFLENSRVSKTVKTEKYAEKIIGTQETISELFARLSLDFRTQKKIFNYARRKNITIFSTPFDIESVDFLEKLGVSLYKIASADLVNLPLIKYVAKKLKPMIISTGMSKISEIDEAVETVKSTGNKNLILLHCNSSYPTTYSEVNLKFMDTLRQMYSIPVGFSDHTTDLLSSKVAILRGADLIERHFTLSKEMDGPDHILSSNKKEMKQLVDFKKNFNQWNKVKDDSFDEKATYKNIKTLLGDGIKKIQPNEYFTINSQKKSIYAKKKIKKGDKFSNENTCVKGPLSEIMPKYIDIIIGRKAKNDIDLDHPILWNDI